MDNFNLDMYEKKMLGAMDNLITNFSGLRSGRASSSLVDSLVVEAYGQNMKIKDLASVNVPEARTIKISVWDTSLVSQVEKSIIKSSLELSPITEGQVIRINLPELTKERRVELAKSVRSLAEESKVAIRNIRQDGMNSIKKLSNENFSEDELKKLQESLQKLTNNFIEKISEKTKTKENEILQI